MIAAIGIDIGKNSFHVVGWMDVRQSRCGRSGRVDGWKHASPICRPA
jgi:hypothetical protein